MSKATALDVSHELMQRWKSFELPPFDLYSRMDGQRLIVTPSGLCTSEDLTGKLMHMLPHWYVVGRDEHRVVRERARLAKEYSLFLARHMQYNRENILGRDKLFESEAIKASDAQIRFDPTGVSAESAYVMPDLFVTYPSKTGRLMFRKILLPETSNVDSGASVPRKVDRRRKKKDSAGKS